MSAGPAGGAVPELLAVGERDELQQRAGLAATQRRDDRRDLVALVDHVELPADAIEDAGVRAFDHPGLHVLVFAVLVHAVELDVDVRVRPLKIRDLTLELDLMLVVVHRERVMRPSGGSRR